MCSAPVLLHCIPGPAIRCLNCLPPLSTIPCQLPNPAFVIPYNPSAAYYSQNIPLPATVFLELQCSAELLASAGSQFLRHVPERGAFLAHLTNHVVLGSLLHEAFGRLHINVAWHDTNLRLAHYHKNVLRPGSRSKRLHPLTSGCPTLSAILGVWLPPKLSVQRFMAHPNRLHNCCLKLDPLRFLLL